MTELLNTQLGQYHLIDIVGRGGMSTVYKGYQEALDRFVAVKVLSSHRDPQFAARFKREARAIAALQHHNILPVYDFNQQGDLLYLVLQYIENGTTLANMLGRPMQPVTALRLTSHVLEALEYAHKRGIIHRDIKPGNVLMPAPNWALLADFGIAKLMNDNQRLTLANQIIGTAAYMAPEQATGRPIDARTDLYAAGVVLYELVTGRVPFDADTPMAVLTKHVYEPPPAARTLNPDISPLIEHVLQRALAKEPSERFQSAADMSAELLKVAGQLEQQRQSRIQMTGLYEIGLEAFQQKRFNDAVGQLRKLVELDPDNEDANELLGAALDAQGREKLEARQQVERLNQKPSSPPAASSKQAAGNLATIRLPQIDDIPAPPKPVAAAQNAPTTPIVTAQPLASSSTQPLPEQPATPAIAPKPTAPAPTSAASTAAAAGSNKSVIIAWVIAGAVVVALIVALFVLLR
ncbi:MAG: protein kinase [Chloroflexi bacterium SZAS-1]|jgi:serine/threonine-protein kinase|nr:protein kinase [Chloroflexi bacterium SZAS-1]